MKSSERRKILVIDDESSVSRFIRHSLEAQGYEVVEALTGEEGLQRVIETRPELIILDLGLPDLSGIEILKRLREWSKTPVIVLTARDSDEDKVQALDGGADDYLTKPFSIPELTARMRLAFRHASSLDSTPIFHLGPLEVDRAGRMVRLEKKELKLTATEYSLLNVLIGHAGKVVPHRTILNDVWGPNSVEHTHYLRVYFGQLRKKFEAALPGAGDLIENASGIGYRLRPPEK